MNGISADTTTIAVAPRAMIASAIGIETGRGIATGIEMTTATQEIHVETKTTRTETGAI